MDFFFISHIYIFFWFLPRPEMLFRQEKSPLTFFMTVYYFTDLFKHTEREREHHKKNGLSNTGDSHEASSNSKSRDILHLTAQVYWESEQVSVCVNSLTTTCEVERTNHFLPREFTFGVGLSSIAP